MYTGSTIAPPPPCYRPVPPGPKTGPINWDVRTNYAGEICTPFTQWVQPDTPHCTQVDFPAFSRLPAELQIHVLGFCSSATLFRVMQTSSALRYEAKKLFWSDPDAWYQVDGRWLCAGGFPGETHCAMDFLHNVQQIEVGFGDFWQILHSDEHRQEGGCPEWEAQRIHDFWHTVQRLFPVLSRVVLSENLLRKPESISLGLVQKALETCPSGIEVYASLLTLGDPQTYRITRYRNRFNNEHGRWEVTDSVWERQGIIPPPKEWRGPVGEYAQAQYRTDRYEEMIYGEELLLIQAIERACFGEQGQMVKCPYDGCEVQFANGREWAVHATETAHDRNVGMPALYQEEAAKRKDRVKCAQQGHMRQFRSRLRERFKMANQQERDTMKQAFLNQLEQDPDYAQSKPAQKSDLWWWYLDDLSNMGF